MSSIIISYVSQVYLFYEIFSFVLIVNFVNECSIVFSKSIEIIFFWKNDILFFLHDLFIYFLCVEITKIYSLEKVKFIKWYSFKISKKSFNWKTFSKDSFHALIKTDFRQFRLTYAEALFNVKYDNFYIPFKEHIMFLFKKR